jgi:hypothetical protein
MKDHCQIVRAIAERRRGGTCMGTCQRGNRGMEREQAGGAGLSSERLFFCLRIPLAELTGELDILLPF